MMATMDQIKSLWQEGKRAPADLFNIINNFYGMGGQTQRRNHGLRHGGPHRRGHEAQRPPCRAGGRLQPPGRHRRLCRKKKLLLAKTQGPVLLDVVTYRFCGHSPSDSSCYRTKEEIEAWQEQDSIVSFASSWSRPASATEADLRRHPGKGGADMLRNIKLAIDETVSPRIDIFGEDQNFIGDLMFSNQTRRVPWTTPAGCAPAHGGECPRVQAIANKERFGLDDNGKPVSKNRVYQLRDGLFEAIIDHFYEGPHPGHLW